MRFYRLDGNENNYIVEKHIIIVSEDSKRSGIKMTDKQIQRQALKIKKAIFDDFKEHEDGTYQGVIKVEVLAILDKYIPLNKVIDDIEFLTIINKCSKDLVIYLSEKLEGVDNRLMKLYCYDFVNQSFSSIYTIKLINPEENNDSMYI